MPLDTARSDDAATAGLTMAPGLTVASQAPRAVFEVECVGADGAVKWRDGFANMVFTAGKLDLLNVYFGATAKPSAWYAALKSSAAGEAAADTLASHGGWTEITSVYTSANRPTVTFTAATALATVNGQIAGTASVPITGGGAVTGVGLTQQQVKATNTGVLYNAGDFSASRTVASDDTLNITVTITQT